MNIKLRANWASRIAMLPLMMASITTLSICRADPLELSATEKSDDSFLSLALIGYNYTDRHISDYRVDGVGGANVHLSSPSSGGSGITCCVRLFMTKTVPPSVKVQWQVDGCTYVMSNPRTGATQELTHFFYKETEVDVSRVVGQHPSYLETHFYPDGSIKVQLTENISHPRLALDKGRPDKSSFPRCKDGKKPS